MILRDILVRDARPQIGQVEVAHFLPVYDMGVEVELAVANNPFDVCNRQLTVPAGIDMNDKRSKVPFGCSQGQVRTVDAAAQAKNAVVLATPSRSPDLGQKRIESRAAFRAWKPLGPRDRVKAVAVVAHPGVIELDLRVRCIHDTAGADGWNVDR